MFIEIANAANSTATNNMVFSSQMDFGDFIGLAISLVVLFAGIFSIGYILWGGVLLILSGGKDEKITPAINSIRYALIGLIVIVISIFVFPRLASLLGLDVKNYSSPDKIFNNITQLGNKVFGQPSNGLDLDSPNDIDADFTKL
ncbi:MAG: hypothetical protein N4A38_04830 [Candidatus Gracilibacteria bacterium]|nr:hypothetical protein [Candidatus Gracilibacteria bacterium]